ncbi:MAG: ABC transporter permease, partial [Coriobacteriales bacterium]|nr:ABC transporter permease [Coriobacteriales bacterium]
AIVFSRLMVRADASIPNFPIYLILGNTAWSLMADATRQGMESIIHAQSLLKKVKINRWVFPVQKVLFAVVNYVFSSAAVAVVRAFFGWWPSIYILYLPLGILYLTIFCVGLSLLLSSLAVFFRDVIHLWGVFLTAWMYLTPLFYSITILPEWMQSLMRFNPMYLYITFIRRALLWRIDPGIMVHLGCIGFALVSLGIGYLVFRKTEDRFILFI